jgi:hypothetical protein
MSIFRLLPLSLLIAVSAAPAAAQTSPEKAPVAVPWIDSSPLNARIGEYSPGLNQFSVPKVWLNGPDRKPPDDIFCLKMRSYKVARDQPDSDATHLVGYSTCQPAARFRTYTVKGVILPEQP